MLPWELKDKIIKNNIADFELLRNYLIMLPLIMACSIRVPQVKKDKPFKDEYIVPQLLTQWLINSPNRFDGIAYFSNATKTRSRRNYKLYQNLVVPVKQALKSGYCENYYKK